MRRKFIAGIIVISVLVFFASMLAPVRIDDMDGENVEDVRQPGQFLPWQIEPTPKGSTRVFGIALGETRLQEANQLYHEGAEVSLFVSPEGRYTIEAYFDKVVLGGFSSQMVLVVTLPQEQQAAMFQRGIRVSSLGGGRKKVVLSPEDLQTVYSSPVTSLTYLTRARLDDELLKKRFGEPEKRILETETQTTHWLYPELGLDVALSENGRAVLQYVPPEQFFSLMQPLLNKEALTETREQ